MKKTRWVILLLSVFFANPALATLLEYTYTDSSSVEIGSLILDDSFLDGTSSQTVSNANIYDLNFSYNGISFDISDVVGFDNTIFDSSISPSTIVNGDGYLAANSSFTETILIFPGAIDIGGDLIPGSWSTSVYISSAVPEPASLALLAIGIVSFSFSRKRA